MIFLKIYQALDIMLNKLFLFICIFFHSLFANNLESLSNNIFNNPIKDVEILYDIDNIYSKENIFLQDSKFLKSEKRALGYIKNTIWTKVVLENKTDINKKILLINPKVNINSIEVFIYKEKELINSHILGNENPINNREISSKYSHFSILLEANSKYEIYSKIKSKSPIDITWLISIKKDFLSFIIQESTLWGIFAGLIFALIIYNLSIFKSLKETVYLSYVLHGLFALIFQFSTNGIFYQLELYENLKIFNSISWFSAEFTMLFLIIFSMLFFNTKKFLPKINKILLFLAFSTTMIILIFIYSFFYPEIIIYTRNIMKFFAIIVFLFLIFVGFFAVKTQLIGAKYYLIGQGAFFATFIYQQIGGLINNETTIFSIYSNALGMLLDIIFLSLALSQRISLLKNEKEKNEKLLISQSSFTAIGKTIGNLSHQWKIPISQLGIFITRMESILWKNNISKNNELNPIISDMRKSLDFMNESIKEFNTFYSQSNNKIKFNCDEEISFIIDLLSAKTLYIGAKINRNIDKTIEITTYKNAFLNIVLILIDNALDIFKERNIKHGIINIEILELENNLQITINDNGGGISIYPIEKIFDIFISEKNDGSGLGLPMAKILINDRLNGTINVTNENNGACFKILI